MPIVPNGQSGTDCSSFVWKHADLSAGFAELNTDMPVSVMICLCFAALPLRGLPCSPGYGHLECEVSFVPTLNSSLQTVS